MNKKNYNYFDTTADIGITVTAANLTEALKHSAHATLNLITDIEKIDTTITKTINITSEDEYGLLYDWITELLILLDSENFMTSKYNIKIDKKDNQYHLHGTLLGDQYDTTKYNYKTEVKAITYHEMNIEENENTTQIRFIVDL